MKIVFLDTKARRIWVVKNGISFTEQKFDIDVNSKEVLTAIAFIKLCCTKRLTINTTRSSYRLKHIAEDFGSRFNKITGKDILSDYVSNGDFIFAAYKCGYKPLCMPGSLNCYFRLSYKGRLKKC